VAVTVDAFVRAATSGRCDRARRLLAADPAIAQDRWARLVLGRGWDADAREPGGPLGWAPLLYVAHSCFASVELARDLLARGADPNATFTNEHGAMSAIYGAAGVLHDPQLTALLLEAGADPNDGESLYHATEAPDTACLRLLLEHGARPAGTAALAHAIDDDRLEHVRLLLAAGDRRGGEWSTPPAQWRTAYQNAVLRGRDETAALLAELGASTQVAPEDLAVAALARGEAPATPLPDRLSADAQETLILAALDGRLDAIVDALGPDFFGHVGGGPPGTLLHHAAWVGDAETVQRLLAHGANPLALSGAEFDTPIAWAALGSQWHELAGRDYVAVVQRLLDAGAPLEPRFAEVAEGPLAGWLADRL
jgi:ankyrin repeat protein